MKINENDIIHRLQTVLDTHFDPRWGSPFWLNRMDELGFDPRKEITSLAALNQLGTVPREALAQMSINEFIPEKYHGDLNQFVTAETGGSTGPPARTAYLKEEFHDAFVAPFLAAAQHTQFPRDENWLYIGPSGPHIIGKAARACAVGLGSIDPFSIDFDPRWIQKLVPGSMAHSRYVEHVLSQAEAILKSQDVGVLFATPPVLTALGKLLCQSCRERIRGIHLGGMSADEDFWHQLTSEWFPNSVAMAGYGNSLAGMCPQLELVDGTKPVYYAHGNRLIVDVHNSDKTGRGQVMFHRLDLSCFLPNMLERDVATIKENARSVNGFQQMGIMDPKPAASSTPTLAGALY